MFSNCVEWGPNKLKQKIPPLHPSICVSLHLFLWHLLKNYINYVQMTQRKKIVIVSTISMISSFLLIIAIGYVQLTSFGCDLPHSHIPKWPLQNWSQMHVPSPISKCLQMFPHSFSNSVLNSHFLERPHSQRRDQIWNERNTLWFT